MEETVSIPGPFGGSQTLQVTALGRSKAVHEFLVLHYFGVDSAMHLGCTLVGSPACGSAPGVPQPAGPLLWKCLVPRTSRRPHRRMPHVMFLTSVSTSGASLLVALLA